MKRPPGSADPEGMTSIGPTGGISSGAWSAIGGGLRSQFQTQVQQQVLDQAGLTDPAQPGGVSESLDLLHDAGRRVTEAGLEAAQQDLIGHFLDVTR